MSRNKATGTRAESAVRDYLRGAGFPYVERLAASGAKDRGDLTGMPGRCVEIKAVAEINLGKFMGEAEAEALNCGPDVEPYLIIKRRMKPVHLWYFVTTVEVGAGLWRADS